jgi:hypothetical protein
MGSHFRVSKCRVGYCLASPFPDLADPIFSFIDWVPDSQISRAGVGVCKPDNSSNNSNPSVVCKSYIAANIYWISWYIPTLRSLTCEVVMDYLGGVLPISTSEGDS